VTRVLILVRELNESGESRQIAYVSNKLIDRGYYVKILAYSVRKLFYNYKANIDIINEKSISKIIGILSKIYTFLHKENNMYIQNKIIDYFIGKLSKTQQNLFEILINNMPTDFDHYIVFNHDLAVPLYIAKVNGKKYYNILGFVYGQYLQYLGRKDKYYLDIYEYSLRLPFYFLLASSFIRDEIMKYNNNFRYQIVGSGVDTSVFYPRRVDKENSDVYKILVLLRKSKLKGDDIALKVINEVSKKLRIRALLIGYDRKFHGKLNFDYLKFPYLRDNELAKVYSSADVFLFTSYIEGFGLPPLEAMACGTPVVTTNAKGNMEYIKPNINALVSEPGDVNSLVKNVIKVLTDYKLKESLIENGLQTAKEWTWDKVTDRYEKAFKED
jgi:glycosyltransferase involved in cell wall biosynthesis